MTDRESKLLRLMRVALRDEDAGNTAEMANDLALARDGRGLWLLLLTFAARQLRTAADYLPDVADKIMAANKLLLEAVSYANDEDP